MTIDSRIPTSLDKQIALKVRVRRMERQMSQEELAGGIGVTFQQIQKYEKGINRISAGRLAQIAEILQTPVVWFYDGVGAKAGPLPRNDALVLAAQTPQAATLLRSFVAIDDGVLRAAIVKIVERMVSARRRMAA